MAYIYKYDVFFFFYIIKRLWKVFIKKSRVISKKDEFIIDDIINFTFKYTCRKYNEICYYLVL